MAEASRSIPHSIVVLILARLAAIKETKRRFQSQGLKVDRMARKVIVVAANDYLRDHPELIIETYRRVQSAPE
jgi:hypothetical protein